MTMPPLPPRPSVGRSSFAIAMKDYTFIRPGIAVTISGAALVIALVMGLVLIRTLGTASRTVERGARAVQLLHAYNAGLEVWRDMATNPDPAYQRPQAIAQRDSLRRGLQDHLSELERTLPDTVDQKLVRTILHGHHSPYLQHGPQAQQTTIMLLDPQNPSKILTHRKHSEA